MVPLYIGRSERAWIDFFPDRYFWNEYSTCYDNYHEAWEILVENAFSNHLEREEL